MTDSPFVIVQYYSGGLAICTRGSYPQELRIRASDISALITKLIEFVPRDAAGAAVIDQIIADASARRSRDPTNAERQRRFRQRRALKKLSEAVTSSKVKTASLQPPRGPKETP
jgi:hypothetical protein